jgi:hypothetical protein
MFTVAGLLIGWLCLPPLLHLLGLSHTPIHNVFRRTYFYQSFVTTNLNELFEKHQEVVDRFRQMGHQPSSHESVPDILRFSKPLARRMLQRRAWAATTLGLYSGLLILFASIAALSNLNDLDVAFACATTSLFVTSLGLVYIRWRMLSGEAYEREKTLHSSTVSENEDE